MSDRTPEAPVRPRRQEQEDASDEITEVGPGILRLQLPIQFTGLGHVNCYALEDERGFVLIDPGLPGKDSFEMLERRLAAANIPMRRIHQVVVTHSHPDHFGGAGLLAERSGADIVSSSLFRTWWDPDDDGDDVEPESGAATMPSTATMPSASAAYADAPTPRAKESKPVSPFGRPTPWGGRTEQLPMKSRIKLKMRPAAAKRWFRTPRPAVRLQDADHITLAGREWVGLHTPGHTEDHLCLFDPTEGILLSGDHVLPTITPHISGMAASGDSLNDYFEALQRLAAIDGVRQVLPAHGHPFTDLVGRTEAIREHHEERLERLREISAEIGEASVQDLSRQLFSPRAWGSMAESETYAHLEHLRLRGRGERREEADSLLYRLS